VTRKKVLVFRELPPDQLSRIAELHEVSLANPRVDTQREAFFAALPQAQGLIGSSFSIGDEVLARATCLEVVSSISVGVDNYDLAALRNRGIVLCHTPGVLTETTADTIFMLIMAASRRVVELAQHVREGRWTRNIDESLFGWDVHGKTLGVLGFGRIGQALARRAVLGFGMPVVYHNPSPVDIAQLGSRARHVGLNELLTIADIVAVTLPLTEKTRGLMDSARFAAMKPGAIFVNGSRGAIVQESALLDALDRGHLRAAGLDVFAVEPLPLDSPLRTHPQVTALPHIGSATHETRHAMAEMATTNLLNVLRGEAPIARVD